MRTKHFLIFVLFLLSLFCVSHNVAAQNGTIRAKFVYNGQPVTNTQVWLKTSTGAHVTYPTTNVNGEITVSVVPGVYRLHNYPNSQNGYVNWTSDTINIAPGQISVKYLDSAITMTPMGTLRAKFLYNGQPIVNTQVWLKTSSGAHVTYPTTNSNGEITVSVVPGIYRLHNYPYGNGYIDFTSDTMSIAPGQINTEFLDSPVTMTPLGTVRAKFLYNGQPVVNTQVWLKTSSGAHVTYPTTNSNGEITVSVAPGIYRLHNYPYGNGYVDFTSDTMSISPGQTSYEFYDSAISMMPVGVIKAKFENMTNGQPMANKRITLMTGAGTYLQYCTTNSAGEVTVSVVPGSYFFQNDLYPNGYVNFTTNTINVAPGDTNSSLINSAVKMIPKGLIAKFIKINKQVVTSFNIIVEKSDGTVVTQPTDVNGVIVANLAPGSYKLKSVTGQMSYEPFETATITIGADSSNLDLFYSPKILLTPGKGAYRAKFISATDSSAIRTKNIRLVAFPSTHSGDFQPNADGELWKELNPGTYFLQRSTDQASQDSFVDFKTDTFTVAVGNVTDKLLNTPTAITRNGRLLAKFIRSADSSTIAGLKTWLYSASGAVTVVQAWTNGHLNQWVAPGSYYFKYLDNNLGNDESNLHYNPFTTPSVSIYETTTDSTFLKSPIVVDYKHGTLKAKLSVSPENHWLNGGIVHILRGNDTVATVSTDVNGILSKSLAPGDYKLQPDLGLFRLLVNGDTLQESDTIKIGSYLTNDVNVSSPMTVIRTFSPDNIGSWFVRPRKMDNYGSGDGSTYENAWNGLESIQFKGTGGSTTGVEPGDVLYICGLHVGQLSIPIGGYDDNSRIVISGGYESDPGSIFGCKVSIPADSSLWTTDALGYKYTGDVSQIRNSSGTLFSFRRDRDSILTLGSLIRQKSNVFKVEFDPGTTNAHVYYKVAGDEPGKYYFYTENDFAIRTNGHSHITISNLGVLGTVEGILADKGTTDFTLDSCWFKWNSYAGVTSPNDKNSVISKLTISNCEFTESSSGIYLGGLSKILKVSKNIIHDMDVSLFYSTNQSADRHGIAFYGGGDDVTIEQNEIYNHPHEAINLYDNPEVPIIKNVTIRQNYIHNIGVHAGYNTQIGIRIDAARVLNPENAKNNYIYANIISDVDEQGIRLKTMGFNDPVSTWKIYNNTIVNCRSGFEWQDVDAFKYAGFHFKNNILVNSRKYDVGLWGNLDVSRVSIDNNLYFSDILKNNLQYETNNVSQYAFRVNNAEYVGTIGIGSWVNKWENLGTPNDFNSIVGYPSFIASTVGEPEYFILNDTSYAINKGVAVNIGTDFFGHSIVGLPDIGASESTITMSKRVQATEDDNQPFRFELGANYPNPFNPSTTIRYSIKEQTKVELRVYNSLGQEIRTLVNSIETPGIRTIVWDGKNQRGSYVASGVYFYRLKAGSFVKTRKMLYLK